MSRKVYIKSRTIYLSHKSYKWVANYIHESHHMYESRSSPTSFLTTFLTTTATSSSHEVDSDEESLSLSELLAAFFFFFFMLLSTCARSFWRHLYTHTPQTRTQTQTCTHTHIHAHTYTRAHANMAFTKQGIHTHTHTHTRRHADTPTRRHTKDTHHLVAEKRCISSLLVTVAHHSSWLIHLYESRTIIQHTRHTSLSCRDQLHIFVTHTSIWVTNYHPTHKTHIT